MMVENLRVYLEKELAYSLRFFFFLNPLIKIQWGSKV